MMTTSMVYQQDNEPGLAVRGDEDPYSENFIRFMKIDKNDLKVGIEENNTPIYDYDVAQNAPNPFTGTTNVYRECQESLTNLKVEVVNMMGQIVQTIDAGYAMPGMNEVTIDGSSLDSGVYFYTVRAGETSITKKMIVE
ncbi:MAG: T9SS type A sorting domain-containing protein [Bacteroidales bacterium]